MTIYVRVGRMECWDGDAGLPVLICIQVSYRGSRENPPDGVGAQLKDLQSKWFWPFRDVDRD